MTASDADLKKTWRELSHKVLASVLVDDGAVFPVQEIVGGQVEWFPPNDQPIWVAVQGCLEVGTPPTIDAITARANGSIKRGYIEQIAQQFQPDDNRRLVYNTEQLRDIGVLARIQALGRELSTLTQPTSMENEVERLSTELSGVMAAKSNRDSSANAVSDSAWASFDNGQVESIPTGLVWFDEKTGGIWPGMIYWLVAAYKKGKTTLMRNAIITAAQSEHPTAAFCAEGSREMFVLDCQAMLATQVLYERGVTNLRLSGLFIRRFYHKAGVMTKDELDAINAARFIWDTLPVYVYDSKDGITDMSTFRYLVKRNKVLHGVKSFWCDYSQLFGSGATIYERQANTSLAAQQIAQGENVAIGMLAQKNEQSVGQNSGYSPGVKGGGDAAATADFLLEPDIDPDNPELIHLKLKLSRHTSPGEGWHQFNPSSGLIFDRWAQVSGRKVELQ